MPYPLFPLELDRNLVQAGVLPLVLVGLLALVIVGLYLWMRREINKIDVPYAADIRAASSTSAGEETP